MDSRIAWAVTYIRANLAAPLTLEQLASRVNLSPSRFAHLFRSDVGVAPAHFIRAVRMARARLLLERTFLSVKEVMTLVGCNDPSHFSRDFRRAHGMAPRAWRLAYGEPQGIGDTAERCHREALASAAESAHIQPASPTRRRRRPPR